MKTHKFGTLNGADSAPFAYPNIYAIQKTTGPERLIIAPSSNQVEILVEIARQLPEPFGILYVLIVPRGSGSKAGRYQSPAPSSRQETEIFLSRFRDYFESDGRHHVWVMSLLASATLVYDNHNVIYAYGPLAQFKKVLTARGFSEKRVQFPAPHVHNYNQEYDSEEREIMTYWNWKYFPLADDDDP